MTKTRIEWADEVWNPVTGCQKISQGCKNCYAERIAQRFWGERKFTEVICHEDRLEDPFHWNKARRVFVNSMSDLFHPDVSFEFIDQVFATMYMASQHTFMILTKRPERMCDYMYRYMKENKLLPNVWLGVSVEDQISAEKRIPLLFGLPAVVRFVSAEPLLGPIELRISRAYCDWMIVGCESGSGRRPTDPHWAGWLKTQCQIAGIPFFLKQMEVDGKIVKMPELDGRQWVEYPKV